VTEASARRVTGVKDVGIPRPSDWHIAETKRVMVGAVRPTVPIGPLSSWKAMRRSRIPFILGITRSPKNGTTAGENPDGN